MTEPLRAAGRGVDANGATVVWSVAEGRRGRRWREVRTHGDVLSSLLYETDPAGRFSHLELSTPAGLLTLHPEGDGTIHGNAVTAAGVRHIRGLPWSGDGIVLVDGSAVTRAAAAWSAGGRDELTVLRVAPDLTCRVAAERLPVAPVAPAATPEGLPVLPDGAEWPLEE